MNPKVVVPLVLVASLLLLMLLLRSRQLEHASRPPVETPRTSNITAVEHTRRPSFSISSQAPKSSVVRPRNAQPRSAAESVTSSSVKRPHLTGYLVDEFISKSSLPSSYHGENVQLTSQGITLASAASRSGMVESPPLLLRRPSQPQVASPTKPIPPGATVQVEISLSEDGKEWTPWALLQRYNSKSLVPEASEPPQEEDTPTSGSAQGPYIRYRLTLSCEGTDAPVLRDVRIWHRGGSDTITQP